MSLVNLASDSSLPRGALARVGSFFAWLRCRLGHPGPAFLCLNLATVTYFGCVTWRELPLHANERLLFGDAGSIYAIVQRLLDGQTLFLDVFYHYGPLSIVPHWMIARMSGNTAHSCLLVYLSFELISVNLILVLLRRHLPKVAALCFTLLIFVPAFQFVSTFSSPYDGQCLLCVLLVVLIMEPFRERTLRANLLMGLLLAVIQLNKFGYVAFIWASVAALDLGFLLHTGVSIKNLRSFACSHLEILAGFLPLELVLCAYAFTCLPLPIAWDVVWPYYHVGTYAQSVRPEWRFPVWEAWPGISYVLENTPYYAGLLVAAGAIIKFGHHCIRKATKPVESGLVIATFVGLVFFLCSVFYWKHQWLILANSWMLLVALILGIPKSTHRVAVLAVVFVPFMLATPRGVVRRLLEQRPEPVAITMPNGEVLYFTREWAPRISRLIEFTNRLKRTHRAVTGREPVFIIMTPSVNGIGHWMQLKTLSRHTFWFYGFWRPFEMSGLFSDFATKTDYLIEAEKQAYRDEGDVFFRNPSRSNAPNPFGSAFEVEFRSRLLDPVRVDSGCIVFPVAGDDSRTRALRDAAACLTVGQR